jgi:hypothetical protein
MSYNFEVFYMRKKLLLTALKRLQEEGNKVALVEEALDLDHGLDLNNQEEVDYVNDEYFEEIECMLSELESLDV